MSTTKRQGGFDHVQEVTRGAKMGYQIITVTKRIDTRIMELIKLFEDSGLRAAHFSKHAGKSRAYLSNGKKDGINLKTAKGIFREVVRTARRLKHVDLDSDDLLELIDETGITLKMVADKAGLSRQAIYKQLEQGLNDQQQERLEYAIRNLGSELLTRARKTGLRPVPRHDR